MSMVRIRSLVFADALITWEWQNDPVIKEFYSGHPFQVTYENELGWYKKMMREDSSIKVFGIEICEPQKLIGMTFLKNINQLDKVAEYAIYIGDVSEHGKGFSVEATKLTLDFAFTELGMNRIWLKVHEDNIPAIHLYKKFHFRTEGTLRQSVFRNGRYKNEFIMAILKKEYKG